MKLLPMKPAPPVTMMVIVVSSSEVLVKSFVYCFFKRGAFLINLHFPLIYVDK